MRNTPAMPKERSRMQEDDTHDEFDWNGNI